MLKIVIISVVETEEDEIQVSFEYIVLYVCMFVLYVCLVLYVLSCMFEEYI